MSWREDELGPAEAVLVYTAGVVWATLFVLKATGEISWPWGWLLWPFPALVGGVALTFALIAFLSLWPWIPGLIAEGLVARWMRKRDQGKHPDGGAK